MSWKKFFAPNKKTILKRFKKVEPTIYEIFAPVNRYIGEEYFQFIAPKICELTGADYVLIGRFHKKQSQIETLVFSEGPEILDNIIYDLRHTPCEGVIGSETRICEEGTWEKFPKDEALSDRLIEGYVGIPLYNAAEEPNGILVAMFKDPIVKDAKMIESLMYLFTPRMSTEIEHLLAKLEIGKRNVELELMHRALKDKNKKLDESLAELNKIQLKSKEYDQLKTTFLANLSHELRTPMNVILGFLELLRSDAIGVDERDEYVNIINANGLQLLKVMDNLIDISKLQTRLMQEEPSKFILNDMMVQLHKHYVNEADLIKKPISIKLQKGLLDGNDFIITDQDGLLKVLRHLLDNALKFTAEGEVNFGYDVVNDQLRFFVTDTGIGIPEGKENIIFDMFRQVTTELNREFGGNGLGLAISQKYVDTLGGEIWLDSNYKQGARFYFTIPYEPAKVSSAMSDASLI